MGGCCAVTVIAITFFSLWPSNHPLHASVAQSVYERSRFFPLVQLVMRPHQEHQICLWLFEKCVHSALTHTTFIHFFPILSDFFPRSFLAIFFSIIFDPLSFALTIISRPQVSWVRRKGDELNLITFGRHTYSSDSRYSLEYIAPNDWQLLIQYANERDEGHYECQISSHPPLVLLVYLTVVGKCHYFSIFHIFLLFFREKRNVFRSSGFCC